MLIYRRQRSALMSILLIPQDFSSELLQNLVGCKQSEIGREISFPAFVAFVVFGCELSFHRRLLDQDVSLTRLSRLKIRGLMLS